MKRLKANAVNYISFIKNIDYAINSFDVTFEKVVGGTALALSNLQDMNNLGSCKDFIVLPIDLLTPFIEGGEYYMTISNPDSGASSTYLCEVEESYFNNSTSTGIYADSVRLVSATTPVVENDNTSEVYVATEDGLAPDFRLRFSSGITGNGGVILDNTYEITFELVNLAVKDVSQVRASVITGNKEFSADFAFVENGTYTIADLAEQDIYFGRSATIKVDLLDTDGNIKKSKEVTLGLPPKNPELSWNQQAVFLNVDDISYITRVNLWAEDRYFDENDVLVSGPQNHYIGQTRINYSDTMPLYKVLTATGGESGILDTFAKCERRFFVVWNYGVGLTSPTDDYENYSVASSTVLTKTF